MLVKSRHRLVISAFAKSSLVNSNNTIFLVLFKCLEDIGPPDPRAKISMDEYDSLLALGIELNVVDRLAVG